MSGLKMLFFIVSVFLFNNIMKTNDHVYTHLVNLFTITANERQESKAKYSEYNRHSIFRAFLAETKCAFYMGKYGICYCMGKQTFHVQLAPFSSKLTAIGIQEHGNQ